MLLNKYRIWLLPMFFCILFSILQPLCVYANKDITFQRLSIEEGLSQTSVITIWQDQKGFMWFGTQDGLNRYDGIQFITYRVEIQDSTSISDNKINSIWEDKNGNLWIGTDNGLNIYNRKENRFKRYFYDPDDSTSLSSSYILSIVHDKYGHLWIGTDLGLNKYCYECDCFIRMEIPEPLEMYGIETIFADREGNLWMSSQSGGVFVYNQSDSTRPIWYIPEKLKQVRDDFITSLYQDHLGHIWIGTWERGVFVYNKLKQSLVSYRHIPKRSHSLSHNHINQIFEDKRGNVWVGTERGLNRFDAERNQFQRYTHDQYDNTTLSDNRIHSFFEDRAGNLWIGTWAGGINLYNPSEKLFDHYYHDYKNPKSLSENRIYPIIEDHKGYIWIGTAGGGLNRFDRQNQTFKHYFHDPDNPNSLCSNEIWALCEDPQGNLWIGTSNGLNVLDRSRRNFKHYFIYENGKGHLSHNLIWSLYVDEFENVLIGTANGGMNVYNRSEDYFYWYMHDESDSTNSVIDNTILYLLNDSKGYLWIATKGGLDQYDYNTQTYTHYVHNPDDSTSLSHNSVSVICEDQSGTIWAGTDCGLNRLDRETKQFKRYTTKDGLPNNMIYGLLVDQHNNLWMTTNMGLSKLNPVTGIFTNYDVTDGLQSNEFNASAFCKTRDGMMFFGGINGFNIFHPDSIKDNMYIPEVVLTDFKLFNRSVPIGSIVDGLKILPHNICELEEITISHRHNVITFEFASLSYIHPEMNQYEYILSPFEKRWNIVGNRHFAPYMNLPPGDYIFYVKGSNNDNVWNEEGASIRLIVKPPFYQTIWFRILFLIAIILSMFGLINLRTYQIQKRNKRLEDRVKVRTRELQDALDRVKTLSGLLPICARCKKIRDDKGYWQQVEVYLRDHSEARLSHSLCPDCLKVMYPDFKEESEHHKNKN